MPDQRDDDGDSAKPDADEHGHADAHPDPDQHIHRDPDQHGYDNGNRDQHVHRNHDPGASLPWHWRHLPRQPDGRAQCELADRSEFPVGARAARAGALRALGPDELCGDGQYGQLHGPRHTGRTAARRRAAHAHPCRERARRTAGDPRPHLPGRWRRRALRVHGRDRGARHLPIARRHRAGVPHPPRPAAARSAARAGPGRNGAAPTATATEAGRSAAATAAPPATAAGSLVEPEGPWGDFARATVDDWLALLAAAQPPERRDTPAGVAERTLALAVLRGALLDLLATGERERTGAAVRRHVERG